MHSSWWSGDVLGVEYLLSSLDRYIGSVAMGSSSSSIGNVVVMSAMAFCLKYFSAVFEENKFEVKRLLWLKIETRNEDGVKFWRVLTGKISRVFAFRGMKGVGRVKAFKLKGICLIVSNLF